MGAKGLAPVGAKGLTKYLMNSFILFKGPAVESCSKNWSTEYRGVFPKGGKYEDRTREHENHRDETPGPSGHFATDLARIVQVKVLQRSTLVARYHIFKDFVAFNWF